MKKLYSYDLGLCYGQGIGLFVEDSDVVESAIGRNIYWGDIAGKHSSIDGPLGRAELTEVLCSSAFLEEFERVVGHIGLNPIAHLRENGDLDDEEG